MAGAAVHQVVAVAAIEVIVAGQAVQGVIAAAAEQKIAEFGASQCVVARGAGPRGADIAVIVGDVTVDPTGEIKPRIEIKNIGRC